MTARLDGLEFRQATAGDAPRLAALAVAGFETYHDFAPPGWAAPAIDRATGVVEALLAKPTTWCELADDAQGMAGHLGWLAAAESRLPDGDEGLVHFQQLFVRRDWWGSGLATRLHDTAFEAMAQRGCTGARLFTPAGQARARRFYEREGWRLACRFYEADFDLVVVEYRRTV